MESPRFFQWAGVDFQVNSEGLGPALSGIPPTTTETVEHLGKGYVGTGWIDEDINRIQVGDASATAKTESETAAFPITVDFTDSSCGGDINFKCLKKCELVMTLNYSFHYDGLALDNIIASIEVIRNEDGTVIKEWEDEYFLTVEEQGSEENLAIIKVPLQANRTYTVRHHARCQVFGGSPGKLLKYNMSSLDLDFRRPPFEQYTWPNLFPAVKGG